MCWSYGKFQPSWPVLTRFKKTPARTAESRAGTCDVIFIIRAYGHWRNLLYVHFSYLSITFTLFAITSSPFQVSPDIPTNDPFIHAYPTTLPERRQKYAQNLPTSTDRDYLNSFFSVVTMPTGCSNQYSSCCSRFQSVASWLYSGSVGGLRMGSTHLLCVYSRFLVCFLTNVVSTLMSQAESESIWNGRILSDTGRTER